MPQLKNKKTGVLENVPNELFASAVESGLYEDPSDDFKVDVSTETGDIVSMSLRDYERTKSVSGAGLESSESQAQRAREEVRHEEYGGLGQRIATGLEGAASGASLGLYDVAAEAFADDRYVEDLRQRAAENPTTRIVSEIGGAVAPAFAGAVPGLAGRALAATPAGLATRLGERIAGEGVESLIKNAARRGIGYGIEGAIFSSGQVLSESVLQDKELTAESVIAGAGTGFLWGGGLGVGTTLLGAGAKKVSEFAENKAGERARQVALKEQQKALKAAEKEALREANHAKKLHLEAVRSGNRANLQTLRTEGQLIVSKAKAGERARSELIKGETRLASVEAQGASRAQVAEIQAGGRQAVAAERRAAVETTAAARVTAAEKQAEARIAAAEAKASAARSKVDQASAKIELEQAKQAGKMEVMEARQQLADTYTSGWQAVNDRKITAARIKASGQRDISRGNIAQAIAKSGKQEAGISIAEIVPKHMRSPKAIETASQSVRNSAASLRSAGDDLLRKADDIAAINPGMASELEASRVALADATEELGRWASRADGGVDDFAEGAGSISRMEEAQLDLAQRLRPLMDDVEGVAIDEQMRPMLEALEKQSASHNDQVARFAESGAANSNASANALDYIAMADTVGEATGTDLINTNDIPVVGPVLGAYMKLHAAKAGLEKLGVRVTGPGAQMARTASNLQNRSSEAVAKLVARGSKAAEVGVRHGRKAAPALASVLSTPIYEPRKTSNRAVDLKTKSVDEQYKERLDEMSDAVSNLDDVRRRVHLTIAAPPAVRDAIADAVIRKLTYLHEKAPKDPSPPSIYKSDWVASPHDLRSFARVVRAVNDPISVLEDVESGDITPEAIDALRAVYPRIYEQMQTELIDNISELQEDLPFDRRVYLSHLFEVAVDPSMRDDFVASMQEVAAKERQPEEQGASTGGVPQLAQAATLGMDRRASR